MVFINGLFILAMAYLWRMGGTSAVHFGVKGNRLFRRLGVPILVFLFWVLMHQTALDLFKAVFGAGAICLGTFLPISLVGSEFRKNYWWFPILGLIIGSSLVFLGAVEKLAIGGIFAVFFSVLMTAYMIGVEEIRLRSDEGDDLWGAQEVLTGGTLGFFITLLG